VKQTSTVFIKGCINKVQIEFNRFFHSLFIPDLSFWIVRIFSEFRLVDDLVFY